ncbi:MAG: GIY-YIG nuclease family protein [Bacteroidia bacterium]|nr:GIY-YIG nuclease family protein [Bacteroidia bacterium]
MFYVYVLKSEMDGMFYTGFSTNLKRRLSEHNGGRSVSTCWRRPFTLIYFEVCFDREDALRREKYLKSGNGKIYLHKRLSNYLSGTKLIDLRNAEFEIEIP